MTLHAFPSPDWVIAYGHAIRTSDAYRAASGEWTHGPVALVVPADPAIGVPQDVGIWLDLERGECRAARMVSRDEAQRAAFILTAEYRYWKQIIRKELGPVAGIMQRKVALQGSLPIVVRFIKSAEALVDAATTVPTRFLDE
ncbi:MAG: SCP2 sterol-binding domain-containing protein [Gemmatimonadales bacterium]